MKAGTNARGAESTGDVERQQVDIPEGNVDDVMMKAENEIRRYETVLASFRGGELMEEMANVFVERQARATGMRVHGEEKKVIDDGDEADSRVLEDRHEKVSSSSIDESSKFASSTEDSGLSPLLKAERNWQMAALSLDSEDPQTALFYLANAATALSSITGDSEGETQYPRAMKRIEKLSNVARSMLKQEQQTEA